MDREHYTCNYDYDADSDLEEDEDCGFLDFEDCEVIPEKGKGDKSDPDTDDIQNSGGKNVSLDIISISDVDSMFSDPPETVVETKAAATPSPAPTHIGTVVVIEDVAFVT